MAKPQVRGLGAGLAALSIALPGACSSGSEGDDAAACPVPSQAPASEVALLPEGLSLDAIGPVTHVVSTDGHTTIQAVTTLSLDEATVQIQDAVTAVGYRPAGMDNEGFEAEVFFTSGSYAAGQAIVRRAACEGQWDVDLVLVDPSAVSSSDPSPSPSAS